MAYEQKPLTGALFKNDKGDNDKRPDYRGDCLIDGVTYKIAAWLKDGNKGKFMSLRFEVKDDGGQYAPEPTKEPKPPIDDSIPF